jgi:hypothetical protein
MMDIGIVKKVDYLLAAAGILLSCALFIYSFTIRNFTLMGVVAVLIFSACIFYVYFTKRGEQRILFFRGNKTVFLILNITFVVLYSISILVLYFNNNVYVRPDAYFIIIIFLLGLLGIEIIYLPVNRFNEYLTLVKIILLSLSIVVSYLLLFPTVVGVDQWDHQILAEEIITNTYIPAGYAYTSLPLMHLLASATMIISDLDYRLSSMVGILGMQALCILLFVYLIGRSIGGPKLGLFAALFLAMSGHFLMNYFWGIPFTFATILVIMPVFLFLVLGKRKKNEALGLSALAMGCLVLTHALTSAFMAVVLVLLYIGSRFYDKIFARSSVFNYLKIAVIFTLVIVAWWLYKSNSWITLVTSVQFGYSQDFRNVYVIPSEFISKIPDVAVFFNSLGPYLLWALSIPGGLYMISGRKKSVAFLVSVIAFALLGFVFFSTTFGSGKLFEYRWEFYLIIFLSIPMAMTLFMIFKLIPGNLKKAAVIACLIWSLSPFMILIPSVSPDNPLFHETAPLRYAYTASELTTFDNLLKTSDLYIATDEQSHKISPVQNFENFEVANSRIVPFSNNRVFYQKNFSVYENPYYLILIRSALSDGSTITLIDGPSAVKLNYDPASVVGANCSRIYDSGTAAAFHFS